MSVQVDNNAFELVNNTTPNKRKREYPHDGKCVMTPKFVNNKENYLVYNNFMEVKSIAEIFAQKKDAPQIAAIENVFEVSRKPPKKKTKREAEDGCFENAALNLNGPEKIINPYEVKRDVVQPKNEHCFVNSGLNLRGAEREVRNPYEIAREPDSTPAKEMKGIANPAMEMQPTLAIGLPFTPTVGCRIDFNNIPLEALTPCSMLNTKLVFSPVNKAVEVTPRRRDLSVISEEAVDISKELDCYQLQLENSMNEAKALKKRDNKNLIDMKHKTTFAKRLAEQQPNDEEPAQNIDDSITSEFMPINTEHSCHEHGETGRTECPRSSTPKTPKEQCIAKFPLEKSISDNPDVVYEEVEETQVEIVVEKVEEEEEFKNPAPFVRTFRRDIKKPVRKVEINAAVETTPANSKEREHEVFGNIRSSIRKSIRRIMNPGHKNKSAESLAEKEVEPEAQSHGNFLSTLRQSLRRKKVAAVVPEAAASALEMSIIDYKDRMVFKEGGAESKEDASEKQDAGGLFATKSTIRHSFRRSSRRVMRSVMMKNVEDYSFDK